MLHTAQSVNYQANPLDINAVENANLPLAQLVLMNEELSELFNNNDLSDKLAESLWSLGHALEMNITTAPVNSLTEAIDKLHFLRTDISRSACPPLENGSQEWRYIKALDSVLAFLTTQHN